MPTPTIPNGRLYFTPTLYTGNGATQTITNTGFYPDFTWIKQRNGTPFHALFDSVRGPTLDLQSNTTNAEQTFPTALTAFTSNGFTTGSNVDTNQSGQSYVGWQWNAASGSSVTNTAGTITSTVSANTTSGFSIVTYTGNGANSTVGHGLGIAPSMMIVKSRTSTTFNWSVYHVSAGAGGSLFLDATAAFFPSSQYWNSAAPSSTIFNIGTANTTNTIGNNYVAYCWAPIPGFSAFGSYTGNGSTDGPFVYLGFRPAYLLVKRTDAVGSWVVQDTTRDPYNAAPDTLIPNSNSSELNYLPNNYLSNGFKITNTDGGYNTSGGTYIYAAFAENPFKYANAR